MNSELPLLAQLQQVLFSSNIKHVGIIAPAGPSDDVEIQNGIHFFETLGIKVSLYANKTVECASDCQYVADNVNNRVTALEYCFCDSSLDLIICTRGGFGSVHLLEDLDWELIRVRQLSDNPLPILGYSDITALNLAMLANVGENNDKVAIAGVMNNKLPVLYAEKDEFSLRAWVDAIRRAKDEKNSDSFLVFKNLKVIYSKGDADFYGRILPLNLAVTASLCGAEFMTEKLFDNKIIIIEDINEPLYKIDRYLQQIKLAGIFTNIKGIILGQFSDCGEYCEIERLVEDIFDNINKFPKLEFIASGMQFGHEFPLQSLVWNENIKLI